MEIKIIGGGLAGSEAAWQIARRRAKVSLYEMRPVVSTAVHKTADLSELVCSNSLKSRDLSNAHGLLKEELRRLGSLIVEAADSTSIPGGKALVVDRNSFSRKITEEILSNGNIHVTRKEVDVIPEDVTIIATGPLTSNRLSKNLMNLTGMENLSFHDAISPIIDGDTVDMDKVFFGSRYTESSDDYLNCPLDQDEYEIFYEALIDAKRVQEREFEKIPCFEGCLPIEVMAERGRQTLLFGPMKPVGLIDPHTGRRPFAVIQLRREDLHGRMYNIVGFQTKLVYGEQERVFRLIPALRDARFLRYGSIHRNTYINSPNLLTTNLQCKNNGKVFFAGQITGVEGYMESTAMGLIAGISALLFIQGKKFPAPPRDTCIGALINYITTERKGFQPMNINFGLFENYNKREKNRVVERALSSVEAWGRTIEDLFSP